MISPIFLNRLTFEQLKQMSPDDIEQTLKAEHRYFQHCPKQHITSLSMDLKLNRVVLNPV